MTTLHGGVSLKIWTFSSSEMWSPDRVGSAWRMQGWHQSVALWRGSRGSTHAHCFHSSSWTDATGKWLRWGREAQLTDPDHMTTWPHDALTVKWICSGCRVSPFMLHTIMSSPFLPFQSSAYKVSSFCCFLMMNNAHIDLNRNESPFSLDPTIFWHSWVP